MSYRAPLIALLVALVLGVGWWFLLYQPQVEAAEELAEETADLESQESQLRRQIGELERVRDNEMEYRAELSLMEEYIPNGVDQPTALSELQDAADSAGVEIETLAFGAPVAIEEAPETGEEDTTLAEIAVSMTVQGGYFQVVDLLRRMEIDVPRALLVRSVQVGEGGEDGFPTLSATWDGTVFAVVDVASTVAPEDGAPPTGDDEDGDDEDGDDEADGDGADGDEGGLEGDGEELDDDGATS